MRTMRSAAALIATASTTGRLCPILAALGFEDPPAAADTATRAALGIPSACAEVSIARGRGALRALIVVAPDHLPVRDATTRIATKLASSAPHILWLLVVSDPAFAQIAFAAWSVERRPPRVAALLVDRSRVVDSDGETLCAMAAANGDVDALTHERWLEILGRESVTRRFYGTLETVLRRLADSLPPRIPHDDRAELALLCGSRLFFLSFLETKGWLDGDRGFLARTFDRCITSGGSYHRRVLLPLLHGTLNTRRSARSPTARAFGRVPFLNGGLFARTPLERRHRAAHFPDDQLGALFGELLSRYRFTAREDSATWSEAAIDPEMMGKAFESIMALRERRSSGAYYTPQSLVERVTTAALRHALMDAGLTSDAALSLIGGAPPAILPRAAVSERLGRLRVLDPACGSGAFLVHTLERIAGMHAALGDHRDVVEIRRDVLTRSIFGVDRNPFAVWLCELRLWLSMVIESRSDDPLAVPPLPNLDHHIRVGDALGGDGLSPLGAAANARAAPSRAGRGAQVIAALRGRYVRASGRRKQSLARVLDRAERARATALIDAALEINAARRRDLLATARSRDLFGARNRVQASDAQALAALRSEARELRTARRAAAEGALPFSFATHFADSAAAGGFDVIVGNPPWVRLHRIPAKARLLLRQRFGVFREHGWERGASLAHAGAGFATQVDLAALFVERSLELLRDGGVLSLLLPSKLWRSLAGGSVRRLISGHSIILEIDDLSESAQAFDAAVYPSVLVARRTPSAVRQRGDNLCPSPGTAGAGVTTIDQAIPMPRRSEARPIVNSGNGSGGSQATACGTKILATRVRRSTSLRWMIDANRLCLDGDPASPWMLVPAEVRDAFDRVSAAGIAMAESGFGRPHLGVKCGCNAAFIVREHAAHDPAGDVADIEAPGRRGRIERDLIRPLVRGETLSEWTGRAADVSERILWPHDSFGAPLRALPQHARHWLLPWRRRLMARSDAHGRGHWWSLFRTESARSDCPRVVWADLGRRPRAAVLDAGDPTVPLNSCYVARCPGIDDARALAALLNGPLIIAWLNALAEPARGGFRRYLGWTMALVPVPHDWIAARSILAPIGARGCAGEIVSPHELLAAALDAYRIDEEAAAPLLAWMAR